MQAPPLCAHSIDDAGDELTLHLEAASLTELFAEAAHALAEVMGGPLAGVTTAEPVELAARDRDALLVDWLNELVFRAERHRRIYPEVAIERLTDCALRATIRGIDAPELRSVVKAATYHGLHIEDVDGRFTATVVLDV